MCAGGTCHALSLGTMTNRNRSILIGCVAASLALLAACSSPDITPSMRPLSKDTMMLLGKKGMKTDAPIFVRIFKEESELEIWKVRDDGRYYHFKTYPICTWSGDLGPKLAQGDKQAPEGFYSIHKSQMNPNSSFHLAFNLGYPNNLRQSPWPYWQRTDGAWQMPLGWLLCHDRCADRGDLCAGPRPVQRRARSVPGARVSVPHDD